MRNVGVLLPAYNEKKNIEASIKEAKRFLPGASIIVVNDGSKDETEKIAKKAGARVVSHKSNMGKGEALRTGLDVFNREFKGVKYIVVADADRQYSIREAVNLLRPLAAGEADFVMGRRNFSKVPFRHRLGNWVWRTAFNALFRTDFDDTNCGFIAMTKESANRVVNALGGGYIIENTLLIEAIKRGLKIKQVDVSVNYRRTSAVPRGIKMVAGVLVFILASGIKYSSRKMNQ
ncbi:MAG: glycosyltransferase family 2 protein [Candidatus Aenigmarchaeota archaeon]|nr:glycosyltransferase family 2 protein [Candidatus Aenigmarchaeota archaeon]